MADYAHGQRRSRKRDLVPEHNGREGGGDWLRPRRPVLRRAIWRRRGYAVTVFEALHTPGGVLVYGIPEFRLPKKLVRAEIQPNWKKWAWRFDTDTVVGRTVTRGRIAGRGGLCGGVYRLRRGAAQVPGHLPGESLIGRLLRQRIPHPGQPDAAPMSSPTAILPLSHAASAWRW